MTIHHATKAAAEKLQIAMVEEDDLIRVSSVEPEFEFITAKSAKEALADAKTWRMIGLEFDKLAVTAAEDGWYVAVPEVDAGEEGSKDGFYGSTLQEAFDAATEAAQEAGVEIESDEEEERSSVVVATHYKVKYAEGGHPKNCGDWIAQMFDGRWTTETVTQVDGVEVSKTHFDEAGFTECMIANGVKLEGKWSLLPTSGQKGWEGRYAMGGTLKLRPVLARTGFLIVGAEQYKVPQADLEILWRKHPSAYTDWEEARVAAEKASTTSKGARA